MQQVEGHVLRPGEQSRIQIGHGHGGFAADQPDAAFQPDAGGHAGARHEGRGRGQGAFVFIVEAVGVDEKGVGVQGVGREGFRSAGLGRLYVRRGGRGGVRRGGLVFCAFPFVAGTGAAAAAQKGEGRQGYQNQGAEQGKVLTFHSGLYPCV